MMLPNLNQLHTNGKLDYRLTLQFKEADLLLEEYRLKRIDEYHYNQTLLARIFGKRKKYTKLHQEQFKLTRDIYQKSDEYQQTRGIEST